MSPAATTGRVPSIGGARPRPPIRLKGNRPLNAICQPPSSWLLNTRAENISVTKVTFTNLNPLWPYCSYFPKEKVIQAAQEEIIQKCTGTYQQRFSGCEEFTLSEFNKGRAMQGHSTVYVTRTEKIVSKDQADCQIDFDYAFNFVMAGHVGLCFPTGLQHAKIKPAKVATGKVRNKEKPRNSTKRAPK